MGNDGCVHYLDVVMVSQVYTHVKTYQIIYFKHVQFTLCQLYLNEAVSKNLHHTELQNLKKRQKSEKQPEKDSFNVNG